MPTLRLLNASQGPGGPSGEVLAVCYTPDAAFVLSGGWDGHLRLWESGFGGHVTGVKVGPKPVSACAITPDGKHWLAGTLEGLLTHWDALTHRQESVFLAHPRPLSTIAFNVDGKTLATASWDGNVTLWTLGRYQEGRMLNGHRDIVSGCRFTPDGQQVVSWSHDSTVRVWEVARARPVGEWTGPQERIIAGAVSPDGRWVATGYRNGQLRLWNLAQGLAATDLTLPAEIRSCLFLLDGESLVAVDVQGRLTVHELPSLNLVSELATDMPVQCAALAPTSAQICLGCSDGRIRLVAVDGLDSRPLLVTAHQTSRRTQSALQKLFGKSRLVSAYQCSCPACSRPFELGEETVDQVQPCPGCQRLLKISVIARLSVE